jgi:hypothetical protein
MVSPIDHAQAYPFFIPPFSYVLTDGAYTALAGDVSVATLTDGLTPVIASGSNRSPEQLARKYKDGPADPVVVMRAELQEFDSVYSAHFASYGSIAATLLHAPGAVSELSITWLNPAQLGRMHETESLGVNYDYGCLTDIRLEIENGPTLSEAYVYNSLQGCMSFNGQAAALSEIKTKNRNGPSLSQPEAQIHARDHLEPGMPLEEFISGCIDDPTLRHRRTEALEASAIPFSYPGFKREL